MVGANLHERMPNRSLSHGLNARQVSRIGFPPLQGSSIGHTPRTESAEGFPPKLGGTADRMIRPKPVHIGLGRLFYSKNGGHTHETRKPCRRAVQGEAVGLRARQPRADDPGRVYEACRERHLFLLYAAAAHHKENRRHHPRGNGRDRRAGGPVPRRIARVALDGIRPLRERGARASAL